jgi:hypothetical protein
MEVLTASLVGSKERIYRITLHILSFDCLDPFLTSRFLKTKMVVLAGNGR